MPKRRGSVLLCSGPPTSASATPSSARLPEQKPPPLLQSSVEASAPSHIPQNGKSPWRVLAEAPLLPTEVGFNIPSRNDGETLSLEQVAALRHCCPSDSNAELGRIARDRGLSLLDALPSVPGWEAADHCCNAIKRPAASEASGANKRPRTKLPARGRQDNLGVMLEDAASEVGLMFEEAALAEAYQRELKAH